MWQTKELGVVCEAITGDSVPDKEKKELYTGIDNGIPYVATKDVGFDGSIDYENGISIPSDSEKKFKLSKANSTLVCVEGGSAGRKIAFSGKDCRFGNKLASIHSLGSIHPRFIYFYTLSQEFQQQFKCAMNGMIGGASISKIRKFDISFPIMKEQEKIVANLDNVFAEIDKAMIATKAKQKEIESLKFATFKNLCSSGESKLMRLMDICKFEYGKALPKEYRVDDKSAVPVYGANGILSYTKKILYDKPSIIVGRKGSAGELNRVKELFWALDVSYYVVENDEIVDLNFLYYLLLMQNLPKLAKGVKPGINRNEVYEIEINVPSLPEQKKIIPKLDIAFTEIEKLETIYKKQIEELHHLKSSFVRDELHGE